MKRTRLFAALILGTAGFASSARAELIMYNGFPDKPASALGQKLYKGFTDDANTVKPDAGTYLNVQASVTLSNPSCFAESSKIPDPTAVANGSLRMSWGSANSVAGAKVLTLSDNCATRKKSLYFRFLLYVDQAALDGMTISEAGAGLSYPYRKTTYSSGIIWAVDNYTLACKTNTSLRFTQGYEISTEPNPNLGTASANMLFARGFLVDLRKETDGSCSLNLFAWGKGNAIDTRASNGGVQMPLMSHVVGGKTYVCCVKIDIDHYANGDDRFYGFVQSTDDYDRNAKWAGEPFQKSLRAEVFDSDTSKYFAHLVMAGVSQNDASKMIRIDEYGLATEADDLVLHTPPSKAFGDVLAYDGFPCGTGGYSATTPSFATATTTNAIFGFSEYWCMYIGKSTMAPGANGTGLSLPALYAAQGIPTFDGTCITYGSNPSQCMYVRRAFSTDLLKRVKGEVINFRLLIQATWGALGSLTAAVDAEGTLNPGVIGTQARLNYFGGGIGDCSVQLETGNSHAPTLCQRANSCFFTITRGTDNKFGLYLNLLTKADDTPVVHKIMDVTEGGTFLCFAQIEVGTGAGGKERIRAFACDVSKVSEKKITTWIPASRTSAPIEHELIDADAGTYPRHAMVGGSALVGLSADEFGLSLGDAYPLVWAKYPPVGLVWFLQ